MTGVTGVTAGDAWQSCGSDGGRQPCCGPPAEHLEIGATFQGKIRQDSMHPASPWPIILTLYLGSR
jgi:hypothetical protein